MKPLSEYSTVRPGLFAWQGYESAVKCDCSSSALVTSLGLLLIDPIPLAEKAMEELIAEASAPPAAILLSSENHQRESITLAERFHIPIFAPEEAGEEIIADQRFRSGDPVAGMKSIALPGFARGETAFLHEEVLIFGDALINLEPEGLRLLPEKYREDKKQSLRSMTALKELTPEILLFAHGNPIVQDASKRLAASLV